MGLMSSIGARLLRNRRVVRAPIWLYRHGLGWLAGSRVLMLEHLGRTSGQPRYVCLEVVDRPRPEAVIVVSGFGERAQWYRNLRVHADCFVSLGRRRRMPARARILSEEESSTALARYQRMHPWSWSQLRGVIEQVVGHPVESLPMVELTLQDRCHDTSSRHSPNGEGLTS